MIQLLCYLNTSHVKVNLICLGTYGMQRDNLNTSHVKVNRKHWHTKAEILGNLNTSHVKVNPLILSHFYILIIPLKADYINFS